MIKRGPQGETVYVNQWFTMRNGQAGTKHVFAGTERIVSKLMKQDGPGANPKGKTPYEKDLYYFHPDHLGSSAYVTDAKAKLYQHLEYFPFGETWVEEVSNTQRTPYWYTAKELDEETGLYYYGARYYDPRTSVWQSADPALPDFIPAFSNNEHNSARWKPNEELPGMGGVYNSINLSTYTYVHVNPMILIDPDGRDTEGAMWNLSGGGFGYGFTVGYGPHTDDKGNKTHLFTWGGGKFAPLDGVPFALSATVTHETTGAETVYDLAGVGSQAAVSVGMTPVAGEVALISGQGYSGTSKGGGAAIGSNLALSMLITHSTLIEPVDPLKVGSISEAVGIAP